MTDSYINKERRVSTEQYLTSRESDIARWSNPNELLPSWDQRTLAISKLIAINSTVLEFGAGKCVLENYLPTGCSYTPSDIVSRGELTIVHDLNDGDLPELKYYDYAIFSGVLEYINDIPKVIEQLSPHVSTIIVSYATFELNSLNRRDHGWVNDYSKSEFTAIFENNGFCCTSEQGWKSQVIFVFHKTKKLLNNNSVFDCLDNTYVVHLLSEKERFKHFTAEFEAMGISHYEVVSAYDASCKEVLSLQLSDNVMSYPNCFRCGREYCNCSNNVLIRKQVANWLSFLKVFKNAVDNKYNLCMVCEDDVKFTYYASEVLQKALKKEEIISNVDGGFPLILRLGYPGINAEVHHYNGEMKLLDTKQMSNSCFIFNLAYAKHVLNSLNKIEHTSDVYFHNHVIDENIKHYTVSPPPCFDLSQSKIIHSNIHPKNVDDIDINRDKYHVKRLTNKVGLATVFSGNFGDLIGPYLYQALTKILPVLVAINDNKIRDSVNFEHYLVVGSILKHVTNTGKIWGIGIMNEHDPELIKDKFNPQNLYAVRGKKTLHALIEQGLINTDANIAMGDPALLLPLLYKNEITKKYRFGIVPHFTEYEDVYTRYSDHPDVIVICLGNHEHYSAVEKTLDLILSCESILSSSLHGLVVAHAYDIPAAWCHFTEITQNGEMGTGSLKFLDYFSSLDLDVNKAIECLGACVSFPHSNSFTRPNIKLLIELQKGLLRTCPFNVHSLTWEELQENNLNEFCHQTDKKILDYLEETK